MSIVVNILMILGCSGKKWRRVLVLPWLLFYGAGVVICIWTHLYYTSLCWREEKVHTGWLNVETDFFRIKINCIFAFCIEILLNCKPWSFNIFFIKLSSYPAKGCNQNIFNFCKIYNINSANCENENIYMKICFNYKYVFLANNVSIQL